MRYSRASRLFNCIYIIASTNLWNVLDSRQIRRQKTMKCRMVTTSQSFSFACHDLGRRPLQFDSIEQKASNAKRCVCDRRDILLVRAMHPIGMDPLWKADEQKDEQLIKLNWERERESVGKWENGCRRYCAAQRCGDVRADSGCVSFFNFNFCTDFNLISIQKAF